MLHGVSKFCFRLLEVFDNLVLGLRILFFDHRQVFFVHFGFLSESLLEILLFLLEDLLCMISGYFCLLFSVKKLLSKCLLLYLQQLLLIAELLTTSLDVVLVVKEALSEVVIDTILFLVEPVPLGHVF